MAVQQNLSPKHYGIRLWKKGTRPSQKIRRVTFLAFCLVAALSVSGPLFAPFSGPYPLVVGIPFSFAWVLGWLFLMYSGLFLYDKTERN